MLEMFVDLGDRFAIGQPIARMWSTDHSRRAPEVVVSTQSGIPAVRYVPGVIQSGDCLAVIAQITD